MAVYVDELHRHRAIAPAARRYGDTWCHLTADTLDELHDFAWRLGLWSEWFQPHNRPELCHYDLTPNKRARAVRLGALEVKALERARERVRRWGEVSGAEEPVGK